MNNRKPFIKEILVRHAARKIFALLLAATLTSASLMRAPAVASSSTANEEPAEVALYQSLLDLNNPWTVMCVAAHPDDEDGATLTVLRRKYGAHTVSLFSTFGEGGQNAIGPELYEELGAIRARETLAASEIQGSEPHFLGLQDFGFSKSADEAFRVWGHEEALRRMVREIRRLRPDVIITNHDTVSGHGHHQATGRLVLEAFDAAANPARFPEQLSGEGLGAWQVKRVFVRINYEGGAASKALEDEAVRKGAIVSIDRSERDPLRNMTFAEEALQALRQHASQGPWPQTVPQGWASVIRYRLALQSKDAPPLPSQAQTFLDGLRLPQKLEETLTPLAVKALLPLYQNEHNREQVLSALLELKKSGVFEGSKMVKGETRFALMRERLNKALAIASGINLTVKLTDEAVVPNTAASFSVTISNQGSREIRVESGSLTGPETARLDNNSSIKLQARLGPKSVATVSVRRDIPSDAQINLPHSAHLYDGGLFGESFNASTEVMVSGVRFFINSKTHVDVAPAVEIVKLEPSPLVLTPATLNGSFKFQLRLVNHLHEPFKGRIMTASPANGSFESGPEFTLEAKEARDLAFESNAIPVDTPDERRTPRPAFDTLEISVHPANSSNVVTKEKVRVLYSDARIAPHLRVGYVRSFDDTLHGALAALGVEAKELSMDDVSAGDLQKYDTIIIDNRGYQAHPELISTNARLLDYVRQGGTLIVFYHKTNEWNPDAQKNRAQLAPYPIVLGNSRVTEENTPVTFLEPQHALLNFPNKIGAADFEGWTQERGLYYPQQWDEHFVALLAMSDTGEPTMRGGLLAADYGRGRYIYTSLVWYRQLRAGNAGAYRLFANMISYGHNRQ